MSNPQKGMSLFDSYGQQIGFLPVGINFHMPTVDSSDGIVAAGAPNTALQVGGVDATTGLLHPVAVTASGVIIVIDEQYAYASTTKTFSANTGAAAVSVTGTKPILSISPKSGATTTIFTIKKKQAQGNGARIFYQIVLNGTLTGASFVSEKTQ